MIIVGLFVLVAFLLILGYAVAIPFLIIGFVLAPVGVVLYLIFNPNESYKPPAGQKKQPELPPKSLPRKP